MPRKTKKAPAAKRPARSAKPKRAAKRPAPKRAGKRLSAIERIEDALEVGIAEIDSVALGLGLLQAADLPKRGKKKAKRKASR